MQVPRHTISYGWWIVLSAALTTGFSGVIIYGMPAYYPALVSQFGWTRTAITFGFFLALLANSATQILFGMAIDRHGARKVLIAGIVLCAGAYISFSSVANLSSYYLICVLMGVGLSGMQAAPNSALVSRWFVKQRGLVLGIVVACSALGGAVAVPLITFLVTESGWRSTFALVGAACLILPLIPLFTIVRENPHSLGLQPDGAAQDSLPSYTLEASPSQRRSGRDSFFSTVIQSPTAVFILAGLFVVALYVGAMLQHLILYLREEGFAPYFAASMLSLEMIFAIIGRLGFGLTADKSSIRCASIIFLLCLPISAVLVFFVHIPGAVYLYTMLFGLGHGGITAFTPVVFSTLFLERHIGKSIALGVTVYVIGIGTGSPLNGYIFDATGSYFYAFLLNAFLAAGATVVTLCFGLPRRRTVHAAIESPLS